MRALIQRVDRARVLVDEETVGSIGKGFLVFLGVKPDDTERDALRLWQKTGKLRIFEDAQGKTNLSLESVGAEVLVVSQFTLYADCRHGNRPSFTAAAGPEQAKHLYEFFCSLVRQDLGDVQTGVFGAQMRVELTNDGPFTIWLDTDEL